MHILAYVQPFFIKLRKMGCFHLIFFTFPDVFIDRNLGRVTIDIVPSLLFYK